MKKRYPIFLLFILLFAFKQDDPKLLNKGGKFVLPKGVTAKDYLPNTLIIKFKSNSGTNQINSLGAEAKKKIIADGVVINSLTKLFPNVNTTQAIPKLGSAVSPDLNQIYVAKYEGNPNITTVINNLLKDEQILYA